ncbi:hypothetical protein QAD02_003878, partial [Eretmocerus hayati]
MFASGKHQSTRSKPNQHARPDEQRDWKILSQQQVGLNPKQTSSFSTAELRLAVRLLSHATERNVEGIGYKEPRGPPQPGQQFKFTIPESCDRIKEEFNFLQAQYHSFKLEFEKLVSEKIEIQRNCVMYYEMSYGLNVEMHKQ